MNTRTDAYAGLTSAYDYHYAVWSPRVVKLEDKYVIGTDPIDPISTPKSEGDDLIFKTTPKINL